MESKYWLVMKSDDGRLIHNDHYIIYGDIGQEIADYEALEILGRRMIREAQGLRNMRNSAAA